MGDRIVGVDSLSPVTEALVSAAKNALGTTPAFWGRYFTSTIAGGSGEFHHLIEDGVLRDHGIRVLPIARQTNKVGGARADGRSDGTNNAEDLLATFGVANLAAGGSVRIFLDVEGSGVSRLSQSYYEGWVEGLNAASQGVRILPCVYGIPGDAVTWSALSRAVSGGALCGGIWLSHPHVSAVEPVAWEPAMLKPFAGVPGVPVLLWQYLFGHTFDRNLVNPDLGDAGDFLSTLVLLPSPVLDAIA
jgi:hypothetical protein